MYVCMYVFYSMNTDDINYVIKTLSLCLYACVFSVLKTFS